MTLAVLALAIALTSAACGGGGGSDEELSPTVSEASPASTPTGEVAFPAACQALQSLKSYRYTSRLTLESPEPTGSPIPDQPTPTSTITRDFPSPFEFKYGSDASVVAPDRIEATFSTPTGDFDVVRIGSQTWVRTAGEWSQPTQEVLLPYSPLDVCQAILPELDVAQVDPQVQTINDQKTLHYTFRQLSSDQATAKIFGAGSDMDYLLRILDVDLWLAEEDGRPARIEISSAGLYADGRELRMHLIIDVKDANSGDIKVEPPL